MKYTQGHMHKATLHLMTAYEKHSVEEGDEKE